MRTGATATLTACAVAVPKLSVAAFLTNCQRFVTRDDRSEATQLRPSFRGGNVRSRDEFRVNESFFDRKMFLLLQAAPLVGS